MGAVGPTQYIVTVNGRFRSFSKTTGLADGALNVDPDVFFSSVRSANTSDPRIRYDRLSGRWFITMIDVNGTNNRILLAVSSGSTIASASSFTFFDIPSDSTSPDARHLRLRRLRHAGDRRECALHRDQRVLRDRRLQGHGRVRRSARARCWAAGPDRRDGVPEPGPGDRGGAVHPAGGRQRRPQRHRGLLHRGEQRVLRGTGAAPRRQPGRHAEHLLQHPHHRAVDRLPAGRAPDRELEDAGRARRPTVRRHASGTGRCGRRTTSG